MDVMTVGVMVRVLALVLWHGYPVHLSPSPLHHHQVTKAFMALPNSSLVSSTPKLLSTTTEVHNVYLRNKN